MNEVSRNLSDWRYGKHSFYTRERLGAGFVRIPATAQGGKHRSLVGDDGLFGHAYRARQVVWIPSWQSFARATPENQYVPWQSLPR